MEKEYTRATFVKRFLISLGSLIIGSPCFFIGIVGDGKALSVVVLIATIILLIMMFGWMFDVSSNLFLKVLVVIGCCCGLPNALICLTIGSMLMGVGLLILPATLLACNLTVWYFESRPDDVIDQA